MKSIAGVCLLACALVWLGTADAVASGWCTWNLAEIMILTCSSTQHPAYCNPDDDAEDFPNNVPHRTGQCEWRCILCMDQETDFGPANTGAWIGDDYTGPGGCEQCWPNEGVQEYLGPGDNKAGYAVRDNLYSPSFETCVEGSARYFVMGCGCPTPQYCQGTPIILTLQNRLLDLTSLEGGVEFDFAGDGAPTSTSWTEANSDDAFLVLDRNRDGIINSGIEMFGNHTPQPRGGDRNGFRALAVFDAPANGGNGDGVISAEDAIFSELELWLDANHNGYSEFSELVSLAEHVTAISLAYRRSDRVDEHGNQFLYWSHFTVLNQPGRKRAWDVVFVLGNGGGEKARAEAETGGGCVR